jgi:hypothetical protein
MFMSDIKVYQKKAIKNGTLGILVGMLAGVGLMFSFLGELSFWPLFSIPIEMTSDTGMWRGAHVGPILNGLMCILLAMSLSFLDAQEKQAEKICNYLSYMVWGNVIFYIARLWGTENRGLAFGTEQFGAGNIFDAIAMIPAAIAVYWGIAACLMIVRLVK